MLNIDWYIPSSKISAFGSTCRKVRSKISLCCLIQLSSSLVYCILRAMRQALVSGICTWESALILFHLYYTPAHNACILLRKELCRRDKRLVDGHPIKGQQFIMCKRMLRRPALAMERKIGFIPVQHICFLNVPERVETENSQLSAGSYFVLRSFHDIIDTQFMLLPSPNLSLHAVEAAEVLGKYVLVTFSRHALEEKVVTSSKPRLDLTWMYKKTFAINISTLISNLQFSSFRSFWRITIQICGMDDRDHI